MDFRSCLYGLSDVIINRPTPLRVFDQIYMNWIHGKTSKTDRR